MAMLLPGNRTAFNGNRGSSFSSFPWKNFMGGSGALEAVYLPEACSSIVCSRGRATIGSTRLLQEEVARDGPQGEGRPGSGGGGSDTQGASPVPRAGIPGAAHGRT